MRIVYVIGTSTGGVGTHVRALACDVAASGHEVRVIGPAATDEHFGFSALPGVRFAALELGTGLGPRDLGLVLALRGLLSGLDADIVHAHGFRAGLLTLAAVRTLPGRPRFVLSLHNRASGTGLRSRVETGIETLLARGADLTIGASTDLVERAQRLGAADARFVPAAAPPVREVGPEAARAARQRLGAELGFEDSSVLVLSVGRIAEQKNYPMLLEALAEIARREPQAASRLVFLIAGAADADVEAALRARHAELAAACPLPALHLLGPREDIAELNAAADVYALTSVWEARALVLQEALISGKAIVSTGTGGSGELIGTAGIIVDLDDSAALATALLELAADPERRRELGAAARARGQELPEESDVAEELLGIYTELVSAQVG